MSSALILMDMQVGVIERVTAPINYFEMVNHALSSARAAGIPVVHVVARFRPGAPEANPMNRTFGRNPSAVGWIEGDATAEIHPSLSVEASDIVVSKRRVSAFHGTDLEVILKSRGIQNLVLAGIATSGAVLSTVRQAADMDYGIMVLRDLCLDPVPEVHSILMDKLFVKQGTVVDTAGWISALSNK